MGSERRRHPEEDEPAQSALFPQKSRSCSLIVLRLRPKVRRLFFARKMKAKDGRDLPVRADMPVVSLQRPSFSTIGVIAI
jgi:hypothetical protein